MQSKTEKPATSVTVVSPAKKTGSSAFSPTEMHSTLWNIANFTTVAAVTSTAIVAVQSPVKTFLTNMSKNNTPLPTYTGGTLGFFKALYAGTSASVSGATVRTAYVTTTKSNKPLEGTLNDALVKEEGLLKEENINPGRTLKFRYVMSATFGDIFVTQIPESLSQLRKVPGLLPATFKWYTPINAYKLMFNGFAPRYTAGVINFSSMLQFEGWLAAKLPIDDKTTRHSLAGAFSGGAAAFTSYPFAALKDYILVQSKVNSKGDLVTQGSVTIIKSLFKDFTKNPKQTSTTFLKSAAKQLPLRIGLTSAIFSIVSGTGEVLGPEPLKKIVPENYHPSAVNPHVFFANDAKTAPVLDASLLKSDVLPPTPKLK